MSFITNIIYQALLFFYRLFGGNLGLSIIALTLLIKVVLLPLVIPTIKSAKKMQELKPALDKLKAKHTDKTKLQQAQLELYRQHGINPAAGCLPQIVQIIVLIALYQVFLKGFSPDLLVMESTLEEEADSIVRSLQDNGHTEINKHGAVILKKPYKRAKEIVLKKSPGRGETAACAALDAALYIRKNERAGISVTILHEEWREQQEDVRRVLEALGVDIPVLEIYYDDEGEVEVEFDF